MRTNPRRMRTDTSREAGVGRHSGAMASTVVVVSMVRRGAVSLPASAVGALTAVRREEGSGAEDAGKDTSLLRRRREELQSKIEVLGEADTGTAFSAEDYEARVRELKNLDNSIQGLRKKASGAFQYNYSPYLILY